MKNLFLFPVIILLTALLLGSCSDDDDTTTTPVQPPVTTVAQLTTALTQIYNSSDAPGFAVSVVKNDVLLYQQAFGHADIGNDRPYTNQTIQPIGSISKTFVAAAVVKAIEQGYFTLDTDINDILPVDLVNPNHPQETIRVRHLVTHTSGLIDRGETYLAAYHILPGEDMSSPGAQLLQAAFGAEQRATYPLDDFLAAYYLPEGDLYSTENFASTAPGEAWNYSNIATSLTALLVEVSTETPFPTYVKNNILEPLGMDQTGYNLSDFDQHHVAKLYWDRDTELPSYYNESYPDGSLNTSNEQLAMFLTDMMRGATGATGSLFTQDGYDLLFTELLPDGLVPANFADNQGTFWFLDNNVIRHDGSDPGTTCNLEFNPTGNAGFILLTNMDASTMEHTNAYRSLAQRVGEAISEFIQAN
ncbi:MAG: serine hydrolase domain-containing protein [Bacteroidota bacterium]